MTTAVLAHAEGGGFNTTLVVLIVVLAAALWLVRTNRHLDATEDPMPDRRKRTTSEKLLLAGLLLSIAAFVYLLLRPHPSAPEAQIVIDDLCRAARQAGDDPAAALDTFNGSPHLALHEIEGELRRADPALALRLAGAKEAAETAMIAGDDDAATLTAALADTLTDAYRELGDDVTGCS